MIFEDLKENLKNAPRLEVVLEMFYAREQNVSVSCFWHSGWDFKIGDDANGYKDQGFFDSVEDGTEWLLESYIKQFGEKKDGA